MTKNLLTRNLLEVFGEPDAGKRRGAIAALLAEDGVFTDPHGRYVGYAALNDAVSQLHARFPGFWVYTNRHAAGSSTRRTSGLGSRPAWGSVQSHGAWTSSPFGTAASPRSMLLSIRRAFKGA